MAVKGSKRILALKKRKARERERAFLIEGVRLCEEAVSSSPHDIEQLIFARDMLDNSRLSALKDEAESRNISIQMTDRRALKGMCETETPQGVFGVAAVPDLDLVASISSGQQLVILDRIRDPGNLGLIIRTAEAADAGGVFLLKGCVELFNPKVVRSTMGSIFRLPVFYDLQPSDLFHAMKEAQIPIVAAALGALPLTDRELPFPRAYLLGNEAFGVEPTLLDSADLTVSIPMADPVNSLNVAVAAAILLYHA